MKNELKPCPFCGSPEIGLQNPKNGRYWYSCTKCGGCRGQWYMDEKTARKCWNTRSHSKAVNGRQWSRTLPDEPGCYLYSRKGKIGMVVLVQRRFGLNVVTEFEEYEMPDFRKEYKPEKWFKITKPEMFE